MKKSAKKTKGAAKRASKDLAPRKAKDVKGGMFGIGDIIGSAVQSINVPVAPVAPVKPAR